MICFHLERGREGRKKKGGEDGGVTEAAAGDGWSERMNRDPDSHAQLSAGSKKERLTPGQSKKEREGERDDRKIERLFQIAAGLTVCTERVFQVKVNRSLAIRTPCALYSSRCGGRKVDTASHMGPR